MKQSHKIDGGFYRTALALALPIAMQNLLTSSATLVDTAMVTSLGNDNMLAAVGLAGRFAFLLNVICFGFSSGCASLLSQYWGAKDIRNVRRSYGFALLLAGGIVYTVGAVLYGLGGKRRWLHSIFHVFVVAGSLLQFLGKLLIESPLFQHADGAKLFLGSFNNF